eukprot:comp22996_c0_seq1/m.36618 comp22996_c0_seq1/g.36618  ORF comp22996_c0_seq1/g.36618 comp22996_c0_seq1/m.36618 type:complete len:609 (-) comp22996_c0_seq1:20-1846(-)
MATLTIRVRGPDGMKRVQVAATDTVQALLAKIQSELGLPAEGWAATQEGHNGPLQQTAGTVQTLGLRQGDILTVKLAPGLLQATATAAVGDGLVGEQAGTDTAKPAEPEVVEDAVDVQLAREPGTIKRQFDQNRCRPHGRNGRCENCMDLEPYDSAYLQANNIKHLSFHSWLRKQTGGLDRGKFSPLEDLQCRIRPGCTEHLAWPQGICTKCQPGAITLARQAYRHVDYVEFECPSIVDGFLAFWRRSGGCQRMGYLYGRYEAHGEVPLGIKAVVCAIYEPPQWADQVALQLLDHPLAQAVDQVAAALGLVQVGWIFTDLEDDGTGRGRVVYKRHKDTYFLTSHECLMAAELQLAHPNQTRLAKEGKFGSKYVTVVVSGDEQQAVSMAGYQVSNQAMALVRDDCLRPCKKMGMGRIKKSSDKQYVPDVFYAYRDKYGNDVSGTASPDFPLDYLLVNVPEGSPQSPNPLFHSELPGVQGFTVENREALGEVQGLAELKAHLQRSPTFLAAMSDFHLLVWLATNSVCPMGESVVGLCKAVAAKSVEEAEACRQGEAWRTMELLLEGSDGKAGGGGQAESGGGAVEWQCAHCTFINQGNRTDCDVCALPRQ